MKTQDIFFILIILVVFFTRNARLSAFLGLLSLFLAIPLFSFWIFFTAERLTWYAAAFFLGAIVLNTIQINKN